MDAPYAWLDPPRRHYFSKPARICQTMSFMHLKNCAKFGGNLLGGSGEMGGTPTEHLQYVQPFVLSRAWWNPKIYTVGKRLDQRTFLFHHDGIRQRQRSGKIRNILQSILGLFHHTLHVLKIFIV